MQNCSISSITVTSKTDNVQPDSSHWSRLRKHQILIQLYIWKWPRSDVEKNKFFSWAVQTDKKNQIWTKTKSNLCNFCLQCDVKWCATLGGFAIQLILSSTCIITKMCYELLKKKKFYKLKTNHSGLICFYPSTKKNLPHNCNNLKLNKR